MPPNRKVDPRRRRTFRAGGVSGLRAAPVAAAHECHNHEDRGEERHEADDGRHYVCTGEGKPCGGPAAGGSDSDRRVGCARCPTRIDSAAPATEVGVESAQAPTHEVATPMMTMKVRRCRTPRAPPWKKSACAPHAPPS